jgi:hypothetical protein
MAVARDELLVKEERRRLEEKKGRFIETMAAVNKLREQLAASQRVLAALDGQLKGGEAKVSRVNSDKSGDGHWVLYFQELTWMHTLFILYSLTNNHSSQHLAFQSSGPRFFFEL